MAISRGESKEELRRFGINIPQLPEPVIVTTNMQLAILQGKAFEVSVRKENIATDEYADLYFENPSNSGKIVYIDAIEVSTFGQVHIDIYANSTVTGGTSVTPNNLNMKSSNSSVANVLFDPAVVSTGTAVRKVAAPGGYGVRAIGALSEVGEERIIPPSYNILVRVINKSSFAQDVSISVMWREEPELLF